MPNYSISNHLLSYNADFDTLHVTNTDDNAVVNYDLSTAHELKVQDGNYVLSSSSVPSGWHVQKFKASENDTLSVQQTDHLGVSDLRVERRANFTYHLEECAIRLKYDVDRLLVYSPCDGQNCPVPSTVCCTIEEQP
jgi:hypothetical protein